MKSFDIQASLAHISSQAYADETDVVKHLLAIIEEHGYPKEMIAAQARKYIETVRTQYKEKAVESFFNEYSLASNEGLAIMRLAEALLRIPDTQTANELMRDTLNGTKWQKHQGIDKSLLINASSLGLQLAERLGAIGGAVTSLTDPVVRTALKQAIAAMSHHFVLGESMTDALKKSVAYERQGYSFSYDMLGEGARHMKQAETYFKAYCDAIKALASKEDASISIKLSALCPKFNWVHKEWALHQLMPVLRQLVELAKKNHVRITFDAEESARLDLTLLVFSELFNDPVCHGYQGIGLAVQAYQKRALPIINHIAELASTKQRVISVRLVKGAYWDTEIKQAQLDGLAQYPVFTHKSYTDVSYLACAIQLLHHQEWIYPQFATHNIHTIAAIEQLAKGKKMEFQRLHGMGQGIHDVIVPVYHSRVYAPVGVEQDLLPYLIRRLLENGANQSFVHHMASSASSLEELIADPTDKAKQNLADVPTLPLPEEIFVTRANSKGMSFGNRGEMENLVCALTSNQETDFDFTSGHHSSNDVKQVVSPYDNRQAIGKYALHTQEQIQAMPAYALMAWELWTAMGTAKRLGIIKNLAVLLDKHRATLFYLLIKEAGKTYKDAVSEIREAIDFCHYYVHEAEQLSQATSFDSPTGEKNYQELRAKGLFLCISPWNFPLAIFTGQIVAALVTGNVVIAKPAEHTSLIASYMLRLMHEAGIPKHVIQLVHAKGADVNKWLITDEQVQGIAFTGSLKTAQSIQKTLSNRPGAMATLIAETGGQNVMIVDSSAHVEQAADDIILSAFGSAGQRCSACRVLYVQDDIADRLLDVLSGAIPLLSVGNPEISDTDIGPVIDRKAQEALQNHIQLMTQKHRLIAHTTIPKSDHGSFVAPHLFEITSLRDLKEEQFGPILHVIRYKKEQLDQILEEINASGYGLTLGIQTRIASQADYICRHVKVGNIYINRSMIGAVVGVQPFGGNGLSGTGFKAGGPHYLLRFVNEQVISENTAAFGGNRDLLS